MPTVSYTTIWDPIGRRGAPVKIRSSDMALNLSIEALAAAIQLHRRDVHLHGFARPRVDFAGLAEIRSPRSGFWRLA
ncbi:hypothetical protein GJ654_02495 [Rhodoblastus acidophilus]|uniref:Uncharacterized protein n=1 Tax=Rhodoblastus acidophilus TaxID=1074 RepID=A0A6N8DHJ4_RHOAC|nr:hypothetical protein [Rhodoblastus acidophilus]MCW2272957.1 hypothetical protein [Rhodoblastus acidophilus]MTV29860.1 hypothetical protein [Rhodoblastus acidophilus]